MAKYMSSFRAQLYGLGYPRQPYPRGKFIERLYITKRGSCRPSHSSPCMISHNPY